MSEARGDVAYPGGYDFFCAARPDELIELHVRDRRNERKIRFMLANDLMACGKGDQGFQTASHRDRRTVLHIGRDGVVKRTDLIHCRHLYLRKSESSTATEKILQARKTGVRN
jgi:hypothetical protein